MKMGKKLIVAFVVVFFNTTINAGMDIETYVSLSQGSEIEKESVQSYIGGVGRGYLWANLMLKQNKQPPLFCYDDDYSVEEFDSMAQAIAEAGAVGPKESMEMHLLYFLQELHPCTKKVKKK